MNAVDERLLHFGRQYRLSENLPPRRHGAGELLEEVLDAALAAAEVVEHHVAHNAPAQARPPAQGGVSRANAACRRLATWPDRVRRQQLVELPVELPLEIDPLGPVL